jgi:hypothetical protein
MTIDNWYGLLELKIRIFFQEKNHNLLLLLLLLWDRLCFHYFTFDLKFSLLGF